MLQTVISWVPRVPATVARWGGQLVNRIIYDPSHPHMPSPRRVANATAGAVAGLAFIGLGTTIAAGTVAYNASDANRPVTAAVSAVWAMAYISLTRYAVRQTFDLKRYLG